MNSMPGLTTHEAALVIRNGYHALGDHIAGHATEDGFILGIPWPPQPQGYLIPVVRGTAAERKARIDTWAAIRGVKAGRDPLTGHYRAVKMFGPVALVVYADIASPALAVA